MDAKSLGQIVYEAYGEHQAWLTYAGQQMPSWDSQRTDLKMAWESAGRVVARAVMQARHQVEIQALEGEQA